MIKTKVGWHGGVTIVTEKDVIRLDPNIKGHNYVVNLISHAHGDHIVGLKKGAIGHITAETKDILSYSGICRLKDSEVLKYDEEINIGDIKVTIHNAGHVLGSAQFEIQTPELLIGYTGDINCRDMMTTTAAKPIDCDVLILETTYGTPIYTFPSPEETYIEIVNWVIRNIRKKIIPVFKVYSTGKAQEIIRVINEFTTIPVITHPSISKVCEAYVKNGIKQKYIESTHEEGKELIKNQQCVYVMPTNKESILEKNYSIAYATGWAVKYNSINSNVKSFPLSNHADFNQLLNYVEQAKPKKIYTIHGFKENFVKYLNKKFGANAQPIAPLGQTILRDFISARD
ncbi:MAG: hypothetical protein JSV20_04790 [Candidatus Bathyarchaeota archaeon]|nr:MAG: hypothetical protein JSV20_04790 [Candidatus Bathyarchaeota archaeon]